MIEALALSTKGTTIPYSQRGRFLISALDRLKDTEGSQIILQDLQSEVLPDDVKPKGSFSSAATDMSACCGNQSGSFPTANMPMH